MTPFVVFGKRGQFLVNAESLVRAVQAAMLHAGGVASDWTAHKLSSYPFHLAARLSAESACISA